MASGSSPMRSLTLPELSQVNLAGGSLKAHK